MRAFGPFIMALLWLTPLPGSAQELDLSGLTLFWETVDILESDREPTEAEWSRLFEHPGYLQIQRSGNRAAVMRSVMPTVFMPSRRGGLDSLLTDVEEALFARLERRVAAHLDEVRDRRSDLEEYAQRFAAGPLLAEAGDRARRYVQADAAGSLREPVVHVLLFENNGFGGSSLALDLLHLMGQNQAAMVGYIGHELHHAYMGQIDPSRVPDPDDPFRMVYWALSALHWEGVASLIDKRRYLTAEGRAGLSGEGLESANEFAAAYEGTPRLLMTVDSILSGIQAGVLDPDSAGSALRSMLPWGGHPNGMYMAQAIQAAFGRHRLIDQTDPFAFVLTYQEAASETPGAPTFAAESVALIRAMRTRYVMQAE